MKFALSFLCLFLATTFTYADCHRSKSKKDSGCVGKLFKRSNYSCTGSAVVTNQGKPADPIKPQAGDAKGWKRGPMPPNTWNWGAITTARTGDGFYFADFHGDHVLVEGQEGTRAAGMKRRIEGKDILWYNNSIEMPPKPIPQSQPLPNPPEAKPAKPIGAGSDDALDEVNAYRAKRGLRPFQRDGLLTKAAQIVARKRAERRIEGHLPEGDLSYVPSGGQAVAAGCAAAEPHWGWLSCCADDDYTYAGAAWVMGEDGQRYMQLFVR